MKQKQGEQKAKSILHSKGIEFDDTYFDNNSRKSMPDLRMTNGRYLEVTHTLHNHNIFRKFNDFQRKSTGEQLQIMIEARNAYERIRKCDYPMTPDGEGVTEEGFKHLQKDAKIVKKHFGMDISDFTKHSEFKCDVPAIECSTDNIIREIEEKASKYPNGDTDLFVFILESECECLCDLLSTGTWNGYYHGFMRSILLSPFKIVYLCVWDFESQTYNKETPRLLKFETISNDKLTYSQL